MTDNLTNFLGSAEGIPKRVMPIFFIIDTSGSMEGKKIGAVNSAIEELIPDLRHISETQADSEIKLGILKFSSGCEWITPTLMSLSAFDDWEPLDAGGLTDLGAAFTELNAKLSKNGFMNRSSASSGYYSPVIILLSDGEPTDDYRSALKVIKENKWYQSAMKIAIAIGEDANREVLKASIKNPELLFNVNDIGNLKKVIHFIAVTSSQIASTSAAVTDSESDNKVNLNDVSCSMAEAQMAEAAKIMMEQDDVDFNGIDVPVSSLNQCEEPQDLQVGSSEDDDDEWD